MGGMQRGGTSRDARIVGNLFYDCKEAAIKLPTKDNMAEGNLYVKLFGGYLRILYPEPPVCLHLGAWQEFYGFDLNGMEGWFDVEVDPEALTLRFLPADRKAPLFVEDMKRRKLIGHIDEWPVPDRKQLAKAADIDEKVLWMQEEKVWSGKEGMVYTIDPRRNSLAGQ